MPVIDGSKYSCEPCIRGHRATSCSHTDRVLVPVRKPGRPLQNCGHRLPSCKCGRLIESFCVGGVVIGRSNMSRPRLSPAQDKSPAKQGAPGEGKTFGNDTRALKDLSPVDSTSRKPQLKPSTKRVTVKPNTTIKRRKRKIQRALHPPIYSLITEEETNKVEENRWSNPRWPHQIIQPPDHHQQQESYADDQTKILPLSQSTRCSSDESLHRLLPRDPETLNSPPTSLSNSVSQILSEPPEFERIQRPIFPRQSSASMIEDILIVPSPDMSQSGSSEQIAMTKFVHFRYVTAGQDTVRRDSSFNSACRSWKEA